MKENRRYLVAVTLLAVLAVVFGVVGTAAPPLAEESGLAPQESSSNSVGHFMNPPTYDSGWVNISAKAGKYVTLRHDLNTTNVVVDITGKQSLDPMGGALAWNRTYGGTGFDWAYSVVETGDGGYALAGFTGSYGAGGTDFWLVKTNSAGVMQWDKTYGGTSDEEAYSVVKTGDGGYALAGYTSSYGAGDHDFWLVKTDSAGTQQWNKTYGGTSLDTATSVVETGDGGYALAGRTDSFDAGGGDFWLVKTNSAGNALWNKTFGGTSDDWPYSVVETDDGGYAVAGFTLSFGAGIGDFWLVKTDSAGTQQWNKTYGGTSPDVALSLIQTSDGGYALAGFTYPYLADYEDFWLVKTDSAGTLQWNKTYGGANSDGAWSVVETGDGGYALAGQTRSYGAGNYDFWLVKTDSAGNALWNKTFGGTGIEEANSLVETGDGGYALAGRTDSYGAGIGAFWLVKVNGDMSVEHQRNLGVDTGLAWTGLTNHTIILYRGPGDLYWNYVRVRIWIIEEPTWQYGDINMDGIVDAKDLYIIGRNYGKTFSLLSLSGIIAVAGIRTVKKRKQTKQPSYIS